MYRSTHEDAERSAPPRPETSPVSPLRDDTQPARLADLPRLERHPASFHSTVVTRGLRRQVRRA